MKRCPSCQQTYTDDALSYCPADGTRLENERTPSADLQATIMAPPPPSPPPLSESFGAEHAMGYETNVTPSSSGFETTAQPIQTPSWESIPTAAPQQQQSFTAPHAPEGFKRPKPMVAYITIGASVLIAGFLFLIWLIGLIAGVGGGLIHLLFLLALLIGFVGIGIGVFLLLTGKRQ